MNQQCTVQWGNEFSLFFEIQNGVRQGGVISSIFFMVYIDELLHILRDSGLDCAIYGVFSGPFVYANNIFLLESLFKYNVRYHKHS